MIYLIAKMALMLFLAAMMGFLFAHVWLRRRYLDVTEEHVRLLELTKSHEIIDYTPKLEAIDNRVGDVEQAVLGSQDLAPLDGRIGALEELIRNLPQPEPAPEPAAVDLAPVRQQLESLEELIVNLPAPELAPAPPPLDIAPLSQRLGALEGLITNLQQPAAAPEPVVLDLAPVRKELESLEQLIRAQPRPEATPANDLAPLLARLDTVEELVGKLPQIERLESVTAPPCTVKLGEIEAAMRRALAGLESKPAAPQKPSRGAQLLQSASYGAKDDLKQISGVGPVLEELLNRIGVYYFWQVASWSAADIQEVDDLLEAFKGRITRDEWVSQARTLMKNAPPDPLDDEDDVGNALL